MVVSIEIKPIKYKVNVGGYGSFEISPLGAGAEAEMRIATREAQEANEELDKYSELVKRESNGEKLDVNSEEYKACIEALNNANEKTNKAKDITLEKLRRVFNGDKVEDLFNDLTAGQLWDIYYQAIRSE